VLQMARLDKEDIGLKKENLSIHSIIQDSLRHSSVALQEKKGSVGLELSAEDPGIEGDKLHLTNLFNNLFDNAIKYCKTTPSLVVRTINENGGIAVEVEDNGIGIALENQKRVFQKFYRVPTGNLHDVKGFGLGLSYVKTVVDAHRGKISLRSELGKGSIFRIYLPVLR